MVAVELVEPFSRLAELAERKAVVAVDVKPFIEGQAAVGDGQHRAAAGRVVIAIEIALHLGLGHLAIAVPVGDGEDPLHEEVAAGLLGIKDAVLVAVGRLELVLEEVSKLVEAVPRANLDLGALELDDDVVVRRPRREIEG